MSTDLFELAERLGRQLTAQGHRIVTAESCTGGWIAQSLTEIAGSSNWFDRGFVTYSNNSKTGLLGVNPYTLAQHGAVSAEVAQQMAAGALAQSEAHVAVAVTGIAGPNGGSLEKPVGTVYIAWFPSNGLSIIERQQFSGDRHHIREQTVIKALIGAIQYF